MASPDRKNARIPPRLLESQTRTRDLIEETASTLLPENANVIVQPEPSNSPPVQTEPDSVERNPRSASHPSLAPLKSSTLEDNLLLGFKQFAEQQKQQREDVIDTLSQRESQSQVIKIKELKKFTRQFKLPTPVPPDSKSMKTLQIDSKMAQSKPISIPTEEQAHDREQGVLVTETRALSTSSTAQTSPLTPSLPTKLPTKTRRAKPHPLMLATKQIWDSAPTSLNPAFLSLQCAYDLDVRGMDSYPPCNYPVGIKPPGPIIRKRRNRSSRGRPYEVEFLLQFQDMFKAVPALNWYSRMKEIFSEESFSR
ncbi:hypothetical protein GQ43DRAFT_470719 [Delitschia confertaspora ATCC 74209]|uniref:Uncharacterized protein n=1 Tax=Delitschia confertaspora ATCC 74209 TaxID=1513339 RepID=A0A9P4MU29_9PLEO|nr:hypothetical protein GQ43DRAFT_470719 [Delitschia confertaspora ATCC 74209]